MQRRSVFAALAGGIAAAAAPLAGGHPTIPSPKFPDGELGKVMAFCHAEYLRQFAANLDQARDCWRDFPEWVEASEMPPNCTPHT